MKPFIFKSISFLIIVFIFFLLVLSRADGYTDPFYLRFTTPKQENLILGNSRSAQGLQPKYFNKKLNKTFYNFSFTIGSSPYGLVYYNAIKKKLKIGKNKNAIFVLIVDPWSISANRIKPNNLSEFGENQAILGNMFFFNLNPNFEYVFKNMSGKYFELIFKKKSEMFLHDDGWLEVTVPMDSVNESKRLTNKIKEYKENNAKNKAFSAVRLKYLKMTINLLKKYGKVYLVRLPVHEKILTIENDYMPDFENKINRVKHLSDGYLNLMCKNKEYVYTDGNHIYKKSGVQISKEIANWILEQDNINKD
jgi:hypothetical protein